MTESGQPNQLSAFAEGASGGAVLRKKTEKGSVFTIHSPAGCGSQNANPLQGVAIAAVKEQPQQKLVPEVALARPLLSLKLFGHMQAEDYAGRNVLPRARKSRAVLAILALAAPSPVLRSRLTGLLWSQRGREQARASLRQSLHELQRDLGPSARDVLRTSRNHLTLNVESGLWIDVRSVVSATLDQPAGLALFQPNLLEDLQGLDPAFDSWLEDQRQSIVQHASVLAEALLDVARNPEARIAAAEILLSTNRTNDAAWRALIQALLDAGKATAARLALERCSTALSGVGHALPHDTQPLVRGRPIGIAAISRHAVGDSVRLRVMPVRALGGDRESDRLPGLAEEITAAISHFSWISCFAGPSQTGAEEYLLDTTLQSSGNSMRVLTRLLDPRAENEVIWTKQFDQEISDALCTQGQLAAQVAAQIDPVLLLREGARRLSSGTGKLTAFDLTLSAIPAIYRLEAGRFRAAGELLASAAAMEPCIAVAHAWWAYWHLFLVGQAWAKDPVDATLRAGHLAERAVTLDPNDARALTLVGHVRAFLHKQPEEACTLHEKALSLNPNLPTAWSFSGLAHCYLGHYEMAIEQIKCAKSLSPHDPHSFFFDMALMMPHYLQGEFDAALQYGRRAVELNPGFTSTYKGYLATLGQLGRYREAKRVMTRLLELEPRFTIREAVDRSPMTLRRDRNLYAEGLRKAGLPEV